MVGANACQNEKEILLYMFNLSKCSLQSYNGFILETCRLELFMYSEVYCISSPLYIYHRTFSQVQLLGGHLVQILTKIDAL